MLVRHKKPFLMGVLLLASFLVLFWLMLSPILPGANGARLTGLQYADEVFNQLSKGSSYFIPSVKKESDTLVDFNARLAVRLHTPQYMPVAEMLLTKAGIDNISENGGRISFEGSLGAILLAACADSELLYNNNGNAITLKYEGEKPLDIAHAWWQLLEAAVSDLQKQGHFEQAKIVDQVIRRAIEPGNNFFGIKAEKVSDNIALLCAFMIFYVVYTVWYGFAIYEIFDGLGLMGGGEKK